MTAHALFHLWPGATLNPKRKSAGWAAAVRRIALEGYRMRPRRGRWMTEDKAGAERHPNLLEDNPSSG